MATVVADMSMSLDGFIAGPHDGVDRVFAWYSKPQPASQPTEGPSEPGAAGLRVIVAGRRTFNTAGGWAGRHPTGVPVIVVTHQVPDGWPRPGSPVSFVTGGIEAAMRKAGEIAGDGVIALASPSIFQQCLGLGRVDRIQVKVVPLLLGQGIRYFGNLAGDPAELENPAVTEGNGVTRLHYRVPRRDTAVSRPWTSTELHLPQRSGRARLACRRVRAAAARRRSAAGRADPARSGRARERHGADRVRTPCGTARQPHRKGWVYVAIDDIDAHYQQAKTRRRWRVRERRAERLRAPRVTFPALTTEGKYGCP